MSSTEPPPAPDAEPEPLVAVPFDDGLGSRGVMRVPRLHPAAIRHRLERGETTVEDGIVDRRRAIERVRRWYGGAADYPYPTIAYGQHWSVVARPPYNDPENLIVFVDQSNHARHHKLGHVNHEPCACEGIRLREKVTP